MISVARKLKLKDKDAAEVMIDAYYARFADVKFTIKTEKRQMCKKEKYEKHRNVLVSFFAFAMLVIS